MLLYATIISSIGTAIAIIAGVATIVGLIIVGWKIIRDGGAAEARSASAATAMVEQVQSLSAQVSKIQTAMTPNGLNTNQIGDVAARVEKKMDDLADVVAKLEKAFQRHVGASEEIHRQMRSYIEKKADKDDQ